MKEMTGDLMAEKIKEKQWGRSGIDKTEKRIVWTTIG
jgi:hypothetical protein